MPKFCKSKKNYGLNYSNDEHICYKMIHDKKTGEEKLVPKKESISITEKLEETKAMIDAYIELTKQDLENRNAEDLIDLMSDEDFIKELEQNASSLNDENIYSVMDKMKEIEHVFNKLPKVEKEKYKTPLNFVQNGLNDFIKTQQAKIKEINDFYLNNNTNTTKKENINNNQNQDLELKIKELEEKLKNNIEGAKKVNEGK